MQLKAFEEIDQVISIKSILQQFMLIWQCNEQFFI